MAPSSRSAATGPGEYTRACEPIAADDFQCIGAFLFDDGSVTFSGTSEDENPIVNAVTGGTGAYAGARGTLEIDHEADTYTLNAAQVLGRARLTGSRPALRAARACKRPFQCDGASQAP